MLETTLLAEEGRRPPLNLFMLVHQQEERTERLHGYLGTPFTHIKGDYERHRGAPGLVQLLRRPGAFPFSKRFSTAHHGILFLIPLSKFSPCLGAS